MGVGGWKGDTQRCTSELIAPIRELPALSSSTCLGMILPLSEETGISKEGLTGSPGPRVSLRVTHLL